VYNGVLYKLSPSGEYTVLHSFTGGADGVSPGSLAMDATGNLYGGCYAGGSAGFGIVFEYTTAGHFETLYNFSSLVDAGGLAIAVSPEGAIYGTGNAISNVGPYNGGFVYKLTR
jgi:uncharacterized repeat protein (TIGR03803 family)